VKQGSIHAWCDGYLRVFAHRWCTTQWLENNKNEKHKQHHIGWCEHLLAEATAKKDSGDFQS